MVIVSERLWVSLSTSVVSEFHLACGSNHECVLQEYVVLLMSNSVTGQIS